MSGEETTRALPATVYLMAHALSGLERFVWVELAHTAVLQVTRELPSVNVVQRRVWLFKVLVFKISPTTNVEH